MGLRSRIGAVRRGIWSALYKRVIPLGEHGPITSFTFDDFPRSALTQGAGIIERFGGHATFYVSVGQMGTVNSLGEQFHQPDLRTLLERGHEIANHTFAHSSAQRIPFSEFERDVRHGEEALRTQLGVSRSDNFAYPYGEVTLRAKRQLPACVGSCRSTCGGLNGPSIDLNLLRANALYGDLKAAAVAEDLIRENEARRSWLIFYTHDVRAKPSPFGCTPGLLEQVVSYAAEWGNRILSVEEVLSELSSGRRINSPLHQHNTLSQDCSTRS
jgi:peptidoglycan/xylan/chitin deacetylase (PgdA/CDA1 family)